MTIKILCNFLFLLSILTSTTIAGQDAEVSLKTLKNGKKVTVLGGSNATIASSFIISPSNPERYSPSNVLSDDPTTAWCTRTSTNGVDEVIFVQNGSHPGEQVTIFPGLGKSQKLFTENNRVRKIRVFLAKMDRIKENVKGSLIEKMQFTHLVDKVIELEDGFGYQTFTLPNIPAELMSLQEQQKKKISVGFEILAVELGSKYKDTCISDIQFSSNPNVGRLENLFSTSAGTIIVSANVLITDQVKIKEFYIVNQKGKRVGWPLTLDNTKSVNEIADSENTILQLNDCGPDCNLVNPRMSYSISMPLQSGLKLLISAKENMNIRLNISYWGNDKTQKNQYYLLPDFKKNEQDIFHITDLSKK